MQQENLLQMHDSIGRLEAIQILKFATCQDLQLKLDNSLQDGRYEDAKLQMIQSMGSVFLQGSPYLIELFQQATCRDISEYTRQEMDAFRNTMDEAFRQTFSAIDCYITCVSKHSEQEVERASE